jgi:hypothetical protein
MMEVELLNVRSCGPWRETEARHRLLDYTNGKEWTDLFGRVVGFARIENRRAPRRPDLGALVKYVFSANTVISKARRLSPSFLQSLAAPSYPIP